MTRAADRRTMDDMDEPSPADLIDRWVTESDWLAVGHAAERELRAILARKQAWRERLRQQRQEDRRTKGDEA